MEFVVSLLQDVFGYTQDMRPAPKIGGPPVTHWRMWLKPENWCLVPANAFAEYAPEPNLKTEAYWLPGLDSNQRPFD